MVSKCHQGEQTSPGEQHFWSVMASPRWLKDTWHAITSQGQSLISDNVRLNVLVIMSQSIPSITIPRVNFGESVKSRPPRQKFWSNALPPGNFQRSNHQEPGRFSIFLLLMNNSLSLRFRMNMFSSCNGKAYSKKTTRILNQTDCLQSTY